MGLCNYSEEDIKRHLNITLNHYILKENLEGSIEHLITLIKDLETNKCEFQFEIYYSQTLNYIKKFIDKKGKIKYEKNNQKKYLKEIEIFVKQLLNI